jgi:hypothetical protein
VSGSFQNRTRQCAARTQLTPFGFSASVPSPTSLPSGLAFESKRRKSAREADRQTRGARPGRGGITKPNAAALGQRSRAKRAPAGRHIVGTNRNREVARHPGGRSSDAAPLGLAPVGSMTQGWHPGLPYAAPLGLASPGLALASSEAGPHSKSPTCLQVSDGCRAARGSPSTNCGHSISRTKDDDEEEDETLGGVRPPSRQPGEARP